MRRIEREGLVFVAEDRVPAPYLENFVENLYSEDIEDMREEYCEFDVTHDWDLYLKNIEDEIRDFILIEDEEVIVEVEKIWKKVREEFKN